MNRPDLRTLLLVGGTSLLLLVAASPWIVAGYWRVRSDNTIRRGLERAADLGCFTCHGELGLAGIPIPGSDQGVPEWGGGVWMMYVKNDDDIRRFILEGSNGSVHRHDDDEEHPPEHGAIVMPAYADVIDRRELEDLVATFKVLSGMVAPARGSPAREGYRLAREWRCFACHGPAGSGGLPNRGSFTGFVPGWYGADFDDLVRNRDEFDAWVRDGGIPRLSNHPIASFFLQRQLLQMPAYREISGDELDALWAYVQWLGETDGGHQGEVQAW